MEFAAQGNQCSLVQSDFVYQHGGSICWLSEIRKHKAQKDMQVPYSSDAVVELLQNRIEQMKDKASQVFISFDIDSIQSSDCPVSL